MRKNEQIIKRIYEDSTFPLEWADKIQDALLKTEPMKLRAINYSSYDSDRSNIECICPRCGNDIRFEYLDNDIYCEKCGQLLTDWDELINAYYHREYGCEDITMDRRFALELFLNLQLLR